MHRFGAGFVQRTKRAGYDECAGKRCGKRDGGNAFAIVGNPGSGHLFLLASSNPGQEFLAS